MTRLALTLALLAILAGCSGTTGPAPTPTPTDTPMPETVVVTETRVVTEVRNVTVTPEPFNPRIAFVDCDSVRVTAANFSRVALATTDGLVEREGNLSGSVTVGGNATVRHVSVTNGESVVTAERDGAAVAECEATPTPTATATPTPTPTPTPTATPVPTATATPTPTPTPSPTIVDITLQVKTTADEMDRVNDPERNVSEVRIRVYNPYDYPVTVDVFWNGWANGSMVFERVVPVDVPADSGEGYTLVWDGDYGGALDGFNVRLRGVSYDG